MQEINYNQPYDFRFFGNEYVKFDTEIIDPLGPIYHNSIILRTDNPYRDQIIKSFFDLADDHEK